MKVLAAGGTARLVEVGDHLEMLALYRGLDSLRGASDAEGIVDLVPGARSVLVEFDPQVRSAHEVDALVRSVSLDPAEVEVGDLVEIRVRYDGVDLDTVCRALDVDRDGFCAWHGGREWVVGFTGFAPGFGYLVRPDHTTSVPRRSTPRTRVPAGSIAMADLFTGVYPSESPGGWQLIGSTDHVLFDPRREPAATLSPGQRVRFVETAPDD